MINLPGPEAEIIINAQGPSEVLVLLRSVSLLPFDDSQVAGLLFTARREIWQKNQGYGVHVEIEQVSGTLGTMTSISIYGNPLSPSPRRSDDEATKLVDALYMQILERSAAPQESAGWRALIRDRQIPVRQAVRSFVVSREFRDKYIIGKTPRDGLRNLFLRLLAREPDPSELADWINVVVDHGYSRVHESLLRSVECSKRFGDDRSP